MAAVWIKTAAEPFSAARPKSAEALCSLRSHFPSRGFGDARLCAQMAFVDRQSLMAVLAQTSYFERGR